MSSSVFPFSDSRTFTRARTGVERKRFPIRGAEMRFRALRGVVWKLNPNRHPLIPLSTTSPELAV